MHRFWTMCTWCGISCVLDVRPSSQFSRSDSRPSLCGCHRTACSHKEHPPGLNPSTPSDQHERSVRERDGEHPWVWRGHTTLEWWISSKLRSGAENDTGESRTFTPRTLTLWCQFSSILTWSASTKMILSTARGKRTSRKRILYPQIMRCFSVCWWSQRGHLYCTSSYWKPYDSAMWEMVS